MLQVLVVWNEAPEGVSFVELEVPEKDLVKFRSMHDNFVNDLNTPSRVEDLITDIFYEKPEWTFKYDKLKGPLIQKRYDLIIRTGRVV